MWFLLVRFPLLCFLCALYWLIFCSMFFYVIYIGRFFCFMFSVCFVLVGFPVLYFLCVLYFSKLSITCVKPDLPRPQGTHRGQACLCNSLYCENCILFSCMHVFCTLKSRKPASFTSLVSRSVPYLSGTLHLWGGIADTSDTRANQPPSTHLRLSPPKSPVISPHCLHWSLSWHKRYWC